MHVAWTHSLAAMVVPLVLALVPAPGCAAGDRASAAPPAAPPPAAEIYAAVIGKHFQPQPGGPLRIVAALRAPPERIGTQSLDHPLWPALVEASSLGMSVPDDLPAPLPYELLSERDLAAARADPARRRPDGDDLVSFSGIGYDADKRRALVYVEWHCGPECGGGGYYELERQGEHQAGTWRTVNYIHRFDI